MTITNGGASQTLAISKTDSLSSSQGLHFALWNQTEYAANAEGSPTTETECKRTFAFSFTGATPNQEIVFNFKPDAASASTQSAGDSETFYTLSEQRPPRHLAVPEHRQRRTDHRLRSATAPCRPWAP